jgi:hypothetical protein
MSLLGATILTAIATLALAVGAIVTAVLAYFAWRKQSREVTAIEQQLDLQRQEFDTKRTEARRAQASRVFFWTDSRTDDEDYPRGLAPGMKLGPSRVVITAHIRNASDLPVFSVRIAAYQEGKQAPLWGILSTLRSSCLANRPTAPAPKRFPTSTRGSITYLAAGSWLPASATLQARGGLLALRARWLRTNLPVHSGMNDRTVAHSPERSSASTSAASFSGKLTSQTLVDQPGVFTLYV